MMSGGQPAVPVRRTFPLHGWLGLALVALAWPANWFLPGLRTAWFFFPLPISCVLMGVYELRWVVRAIKEYQESGDFDEDAHVAPGSEL